MSARRAARRSRSQVTWLRTCGRIRGTSRMSARRAATRSRDPATWLRTWANTKCKAASLGRMKSTSCTRREIILAVLQVDRSPREVVYSGHVSPILKKNLLLSESICVLAYDHPCILSELIRSSSSHCVRSLLFTCLEAELLKLRMCSWKESLKS